MAVMNSSVMSSKQIENEYVIKNKCETMANRQANPILERIHQVIASLVRKFYLQNRYLDKEDPWVGILVDTDFVVQSTMVRTASCYNL